jgi:hypothetical protein
MSGACAAHYLHSPSVRIGQSSSGAPWPDLEENTHMWQLVLERLALELASKAQNRTAKEFGKWIAGHGDDPLNSPNHPASPPSSLLPREGGRASRDNYLNPAPMDAGTPGPFGTGGQFVRGAAVSPRPLYEPRSLVAPSDDAAPSAADSRQPVRRLKRVPAEGRTPFDAGVPRVAPIPFVDGATRAQQALDNSLPAPGAAPWDLSDRFGNWNGLGGVFGPVR